MEEARGHDTAELPHKGQRSHSPVTVICTYMTVLTAVSTTLLV